MLTLNLGVHSKSSAYREHMDGLTIDEAAQRMSISKDTLRYYEKEGLLPPISPGASHQQ